MKNKIILITLFVIQINILSSNLNANEFLLKIENIPVYKNINIVSKNVADFD